MPDFSFEQRYPNRLVCGVDEAGRGPWAGPVMAAAVIWPQDATPPAGLDDSKKLKPAQRDALFEAIYRDAMVGIGQASVAEIDALNILAATKLAMQRAVSALPMAPTIALIDGNQPPKLPCETLAIVKGDSHSLSIAAASIIAKVTRDRLLCELDVLHPGYGFAQHAGYGTPQHMQALQRLGPCPAHRMSFAPIRRILEAHAA